VGGEFFPVAAPPNPRFWFTNHLGLLYSLLFVSHVDCESTWDTMNHRVAVVAAVMVLLILPGEAPYALILGCGTSSYQLARADCSLVL
jgi:hypothetical protein